MDMIVEGQVLDMYRSCQALTQHQYNLIGDQVYIDPYVLEKLESGVSFRFLIGTKQSRQWYGGGASQVSDFFCNDNVTGRRCLVGADDVVFDVGANAGYTSQNTDSIKFNCILNDIHNVMVEQKAVGARRRFMPVSQSQQSLLASSEHCVATFEVVLDDYIRLRPTVLKIDVEGYEAGVLEGAQAVLGTRPKLNLELHGPLLHKFGKSLAGCNVATS